MHGSDARKAFDQELNELQEDLEKMGYIVERMLGDAIHALATGDAEEARRVMEMDDQVDEYNIGIEERALRLLARQQPMARDLRTIAGALKIITDIERAGDYAFDIARVAEKLAHEPLFKPLEDIPRMARTVQDMMRDALTSFRTRDLGLIQRMISHDEAVDRLYYALYDELVEVVQRDPKLADQVMGLLLVARYLERVADHITNIGERIYYMETGELKELHQ